MDESSRQKGETNTQSPKEGTLLAAPTISLPKGGGAIRGMGEKFAANPVTGTGSMTVPIPTSPGRSGFGPQLSLSYDSAAGNGPFGLGWHLSLPAITRKTDKGLPRYHDAIESDVFILSGAEDLVPEFEKDAAGNWIIKDGKQIVYDKPRTVAGVDYNVRRYRPRIEGLFARIERWTNATDSTDILWRSISKDNITTWYGRTENSRIFDPNDKSHIFSWLICQTHDDKGNVIDYQYKTENSDNVDLSQAHECNRTDDLQDKDKANRTANRYLKRIYYGNREPYLPKLEPDKPWPDPPSPELSGGKPNWFFEVVFDYDDGHYAEDAPDTDGRVFAHSTFTPPATAKWPARVDPFSTYRAGFEVRTYRLCQRVLMFHHFPDELSTPDCLIRSTDFTYSSEDNPNDARNPIYTFVDSVSQSSYVRQANGSYLKRSLPPLEFEYTQPIVQDTMQEVDAESLENLPIGVDGTAYQWTDLHGEGIPGILTEQAGAWFYKRNLSPIGTQPVEFAPLELVATKPNLALAGGAQFMDLAGDGQPDLVMLDGPMPGLYEHDDEEGWQPFLPFTARLNRDMRDPNLKFVDLDGDGHADVLITEDDAFVWHASLAEEGFGPARRVAQKLDEENGPRVVFADGTQSIYLADLSGDGLTDLVRIRNGDVCYWPNLGYGHFGAKVTMDNSPWFDHPDQFDHKRIRLADIDGSGTTDIIYLRRDGVRLYFNQSGNSWGKAQHLTVFPHVDDLAAITPTDLLGNGTACLVWSSPLPGDAQRPMRYVNLMGEQKPHLLVKTINNLGAETRVEYAPSTKFYLQDKRAGKPWITRLPFPVHVVEKVETFDHISRNRFATRYAYHHGYFDGEEREFRGFGMVEQFDTEELAALTGDGTLPVATNLDTASHVPPVHTKTWFHTGVYVGRDHISDFFAGLLDAEDKGEYYREPGLNDLQAREMLLADTELPEDLSLEEEREACRSLKGAMLHQEVYALDGTLKAAHPYTVTEQNFTIQRLQPRDGNRHAVFSTHAREAISYHYERNPKDPRISHSLVLDVDKFGNVRKSVAIGYGRRQGQSTLVGADKTKQEQLLITYTESDYTENDMTNPADWVDVHRTPLPCEARTYELTGFGLAPGAMRFAFNDFAKDDFAALTSLNKIPYETPATPAVRGKRLIECVRTRYRRNDLTALLPKGRLQSLALPGESYKLAFTPGLLNVYAAKIAATDLQLILRDEGKYIELDNDGHWWIPSGRMFFSPVIPHPQQAEPTAAEAAQELAEAQQHFFLPRRYRDPFWNNAIVDYDGPADSNLPRYDLLVTRTVDALKNVVRAANNYRVLQPWRMTDPNGNHSEAAFDTLGLVVASAISGKNGEGDKLEDFKTDLAQAELDAFFAAPRPTNPALLGKATTRILYDVDRWQREGKPAFAATLARETHVSDPLPPQGLKIQVSFSYSDGFGREIQKKIQAEKGPLQPGGADVEPRWVGSGWTIFNNKGKPVRQYEPFFDDTHDFKFGKQVGVSPVLFYDPAERVVATLHPNHTYEKVVFDPWQQTSSDVNDTVLNADGTTDPRHDSDVQDFFARLPDADYLPTWYEQRSALAANDPERVAADKAAVHRQTPTVAHFDALGRPFLTIADNGAQGKYETHVELDIEGNQRSVTDALGRIVMRYDYDMLGTRIKQASMEAGSRWMLANVAGKPIRAWDDRNFIRRITYDVLHRPTGLYVTEPAGERLAEQTIYGERKPSPEVTNHRGKVWQVRDDAGIVTSDEYDFKGNLLNGKRDLRAEYKTSVNWAPQPAPATSETFTSSSKFDALGRVIEAVAPDGSVTLPHYNEANLLEAVDVRLRGAAEPTPFVRNIDYDAKGQRTRIEYNKNDTPIITEYAYDPDTFRLTHLVTTRPNHSEADKRTLQDLRYTYDPAGNITHIQDDAQQTIYFRNQRVEPSNDYVYDAIYRLISAQGREHLGQTGGQRNPPTAPDAFNQFHTNLDHPGNGDALGIYIEEYDYDAVGNFKAMRHRGTDPVHPGWTRSYAYNEPSLLEPTTQQSNRLTKTTVGNGSTFTETYTYTDALGNDVHGCMTAINSMKMRWDFEDQLTEVDLQGGGTAYYVYDAGGQRVRKVVERNGATVEERIYLGGYEVYRKQQGGVLQLERQTLHVMDDKQRIALVETKTIDDQTPIPDPRPLTRYQFGNHLGSASLELSDKGNVISYEEYYPYGSTSYQAVDQGTKAAAKRYRYTGQERDEESGLYYHGARYYAGWLGRWVSCDPRGIDDGLDVYAYVGDRPVDHVDPDGKANTPIHEDLTRLVALQYVESHVALRIGRATNVPDTEKQYESIDASKAGDPEYINRDVHVLGSGTRQEKVDATMASFARRNLRFSSDPIRDAGIYLLHPIQDASYHGASFGRGMGHALTPESDLAVGDKTFAQFYQVVRDTERGIKLMLEKGIIDRSKRAERLSKEQWAGIYQGLKSIENEYSVALGLMNFLGVGGRLAGPLAGLVGGLVGAAIGAIGGFFAALFSGKNVAKGAARAAESGFVVGQAVLGVVLVGTPAGVFTNMMKNDLRNEVADKQSAYLRERINDIKEEMMKKATPPKTVRLEGGVRL